MSITPIKDIWVQMKSTLAALGASVSVPFAAPSILLQRQVDICNQLMFRCLGHEVLILEK